MISTCICCGAVVSVTVSRSSLDMARMFFVAIPTCLGEELGLSRILLLAAMIISRSTFVMPYCISIFDISNGLPFCLTKGIDSLLL